VLVLDDGFSWQSTHYRSLSAVARKITGTPWSGPLFFGLKQSRPAARRSSQLPYPAGAIVEPATAWSIRVPSPPDRTWSGFGFAAGTIFPIARC
jgi:hypothetical protein